MQRLLCSSSEMRCPFRTDGLSNSEYVVDTKPLGHIPRLFNVRVVCTMQNSLGAIPLSTSTVLQVMSTQQGSLSILAFICSTRIGRRILTKDPHRSGRSTSYKKTFEKPEASDSVALPKSCIEGADLFRFCCQVERRHRLVSAQHVSGFVKMHRYNPFVIRQDL